jgi:hypothetical protein
MPAPTKVDLRSPFYALPLTAPSFSVSSAGEIQDGPGRFLAAKNEVVTWVVTNKGQQPITVGILTFLRKKHLFDAHGDNQDPVDDYFDWPVNNPVTVGGGQIGYLYARITKKPKHALGDHLSYTIRVAGQSFGTIDYDPDGDIKP